MADGRSGNEKANAAPEKRWSRSLLWPGGILLGLHGIFMLQTANPQNLDGLARIIGAATVIPILAQALLTAGLIALVLEQYGVSSQDD